MRTAVRFLSWIATNVLAVAPHAHACSPTTVEITDERIEAAFGGSDAVVLARVLSVSHSPAPRDVTGEFLIEKATLVVIRVFKGSQKIGDTIQVETELGPGTCGRSVRNDPPWIFELSETKDLPDRPAAISDTWLVYEHGAQPYDLSHWYSAPMSVGGESQVEVLERLAHP